MLASEIEKKRTADLFVIYAEQFHRGIMKPLEKRVKSLGTSINLMALFYIKAHGPCTMSDITRALQCSKQQTTQIVDKMIQCDLVERISDKSDRRKIWIKITDVGLEKIQKMSENFTKMLVKAFECLDDEEFSRLTEAVSVMSECFTKIAKESENIWSDEK